MDSKEVAALISLLDDEDKEVFDHVSQKLLSLGTPVIPTLESAWETTFNPHLQERIEQIIHKIQFSYTLDEFNSWLRSDADNLLEGAMIVSKYQYPELDIEELKLKVEKLRKEIWLELNDYLSPLEQVNVFNQVFYKIHNYHGANAENLDPSSYFLNLVIESKKGNPLSLGILYLAIANDLELPVYGVNLPHHFCIAYLKHEIENFEAVTPATEKEVLFYINPLNNGLIFTKNEIKEYLGKLEMDIKPEYFLPVSNKEIIRILITNLMEAYRTSNNSDKAEEMRRFLELY